MTREQDRLRFEKKLELTRAYGLAKGALEVMKSCENPNREGIASVFEEIKQILGRQIGLKD